jgi:hypothetical protein
MIILSLFGEYNLIIFCYFFNDKKKRSLNHTQKKEKEKKGLIRLLSKLPLPNPPAVFLTDF